MKNLKRESVRTLSFGFVLCIVCYVTLGLSIDASFVAVSAVTGRVEVQDVLAAVRPNTCLVSIMLANNETGVIMVRADNDSEALFTLGQA